MNGASSCRSSTFAEASGGGRKTEVLTKSEIQDPAIRTVIRAPTLFIWRIIKSSVLDSRVKLRG